ncbi:MAG: hypothetical protein CVT88_01685 [Candidatus Altiarchaeales archaeon HGW-Altiarchaeales-1]|nr:MAG: hypothetical protein CVT88_01685 [Candidatus Altiarchaeales archaeon HGW-Altiarchaeales-1]
MKEKIPPKDYWMLSILDVAEKQTEEKGVKGKLKMEKTSVLVRQELTRLGYENWDLLRNFRGPTDPGLSRLLQSFHDLSIVELEKIRDETITYKITKKGKNIYNSIDSFYNKINPNFKKIKEEINGMLQRNIKKSGNELLELEEIQDLKKKLLGKKL